MRFGVYTEINALPEKPHPDLIWDVMRQIEHADQSGFNTYAVVDHHFFQKFSISANPLALFTAAAQRTRQIRFRTMVHVLTLHNPTVLAGEIAEADILTGGRLECGLGRGHPWILGPAGVPIEESQQRYQEALDLLPLAWTQDKFSYHGKFYDIKEATVVPKPLQKPHPKLYIGGTSEASFRRAGENDWGVVAGLAPHMAFVPALKAYREVCAVKGNKPDVCFVKLVYLDEDEQRAKEEAEEALQWWLVNSISPLDTLQGEEAKARMRAAGYAHYASGLLGSMAQMSYEDAEYNIALIGTPEKVARQIRQLYDDVGGFDEFLLMANFGGMAPWKVLKTQELFAKKVAPLLR